MQPPAEALAGARKIVAFWVRVFCDERGTCSHVHSRHRGTGGRDMLKDMARLDELRRVAEDDFSPPPTRLTPSRSEAPNDESSTPEEQAERLKRVWRLYWTSCARWLGLADEGPSNGYVGEGADD